jgi:hypothetical protein
MLLLIACTAYIDAAASHVYGKRFIFIASLAIMMASDAWASKAANYGSLMGARILSGVGQSAFECLTLSVIPDLYYVHQRSLRVALWIFCYHTGVYLGVVIAIQVIGISSWRMAFAGLAISEGVMLLLTFLFFHEPVYKRFHVDPLANMSEDAVLEKRNDPTFHEEIPDPENLPQSNTAAGEPPKTFLQNLRLFNGRMSTNNFFQLLYRSIVLTAHTTILWAATAGLLLSWPVGCSFTIDAFMTLPPYNFSSQAVGDMYLAPWLGIIVGLSISDPVFNSLTKSLTKRNNNVYEPEFRLYQTIPGIIFCVIGFVGWGWGEQIGVAWIGLAFFFAFQVGGAVIFNNGVIGYVIDAHRELANESQVILFAIKVNPRSSTVDLCRISFHFRLDTFSFLGGNLQVRKLSGVSLLVCAQPSPLVASRCTYLARSSEHSGAVIISWVLRTSNIK